MAYESFSVSELIPVEAERIYRAWLDSAQHSAFTGDAARIEPFVGGKHSSFDGYAEGSTIELLPGQRIVQTWRATDFPPGSPDSRVEVTLEATVGGTMVTIFHTEIPGGRSDHYRDGWLKYYLEPLKDFFQRADAPATDGVPKAPKPKAPAPKIVAKAKTKPKAKVIAKARPSSKPSSKRPRPANRKKPAARKAPGRAKGNAKKKKSQKK